MSMNYKVITTYKYTAIKNPGQLRDYLRKQCQKLQLLGRILVGKEGLNAAVCGKMRQIEQFKKTLKCDSRFADLTFREIAATENVYHKLVVRVRKEIVVFGKKVDFRKKAKYITPRELKTLLDTKTDALLLDARNSYEVKLGKFKNALTLPMETFREFPDAVKKLKLPKEKTIITYCTGGIRCEKAATYLKQQGCKKVYQLQGGIIQFMDEFPNTYFEGNCFTFDDRLTPNFNVKPITKCDHCGIPSDVMINCHNLDCDKLFVCCLSCQTKTKKHCSEACEQAPRHRREGKI